MGVAARLSPASRVRRLAERWENPVLGKEFRSRMRGARAHVITGGYTLAVISFVLVAYGILANQADTSGNVLASSVGSGIWTWGCLAQGILVPLMVPAFTCGAITLERERDLLELLLLTRQSAFQICLGKWASGVGLGLILILSSVPVLSLSLLLGGVAPEQILACLAVLVTAVLAVGSFGLAVSTFCQKTVTATTLTYSIIGFLVVGLPLTSLLMAQASMADQASSEFGILAMLLACILTAFPPAVTAAGTLYALRIRRGGAIPARSWWILTSGLCWAGMLLLLYLPGMTELLLQGHVLLLLHPVFAIYEVMRPWGFGTGVDNLWWICSLVYLAIAGAFFLLAVTRVQRMRGT